MEHTHHGCTRRHVLRAHGADRADIRLQPHRVEDFQLSSDPLFVAKGRDVAGLYMSPPPNALVLCVDEKSQIQPWNAANRCYRCVRGSLSESATTTSGMALSPCLLLLMWKVAGSRANATNVIRRTSYWSSSVIWKGKRLRTSTCIW